MTPSACLIDTAVLLYPLGKPHALRQPCIDVLAAAVERRVFLHASVEAIQELVFHRLRRVGRAQAVLEGHRAHRMCRLHAFDIDVLERSLGLVERSPVIGGRDAVHAATALVHDLDTVISPDKAFDHVPGLRRLDPRDVGASL